MIVVASLCNILAYTTILFSKSKTIAHKCSYMYVLMSIESWTHCRQGPTDVATGQIVKFVASFAVVQTSALRAAVGGGRLL